MWLHSLKVAQLLRSATCLHTNQSRSYLNHLVYPDYPNYKFRSDIRPSLRLTRMHMIFVRITCVLRRGARSFYTCKSKIHSTGSSYVTDDGRLFKTKRVIRIVYTYHTTECTKLDVSIYLTGRQNKVKYKKRKKSNTTTKDF